MRQYSIILPIHAAVRATLRAIAPPALPDGSAALRLLGRFEHGRAAAAEYWTFGALSNATVSSEQVLGLGHCVANDADAELRLAIVSDQWAQDTMYSLHLASELCSRCSGVRCAANSHCDELLARCVCDTGLVFSDESGRCELVVQVLLSEEMSGEANPKNNWLELLLPQPMQPALDPDNAGGNATTIEVSVLTYGERSLELFAKSTVSNIDFEANASTTMPVDGGLRITALLKVSRDRIYIDLYNRYSEGLRYSFRSRVGSTESYCTGTSTMMINGTCVRFVKYASSSTCFQAFSQPKRCCATGLHRADKSAYNTWISPVPARAQFSRCWCR
jgi:hypothetical protein